MDSSSDDDEVVVTTSHSLCHIDASGLIRSVSSIDYPVKFSSDSFVFHYVDNVLMIFMNPMFIWRLIYANKYILDIGREFDFHKLKLFVLRLGPELYLTSSDIEYKLDGVVNYKSNLQMFDLLYIGYSRLYMSIQRGYDQTDVVKNLLDGYILLLRYISDS